MNVSATALAEFVDISISSSRLSAEPLSSTITHKLTPTGATSFKMGRSSTRAPHPIVEKLRNDLELIESVANSGVVDIHDLGDENDELKDVIEDLTQRLQKKENQLLIKTNEVEGHWIGSTECRRKLDDAVQANLQLHAQLQGTKDHNSELSRQLGNFHGYIAVLKEELVRLGSLHTENASLKLQVGNMKKYILNPSNSE